jgi:cytochrome P450
VELATNVEDSEAAPERDLGGCPVMHQDFAKSRPYGEHWQLAKQLRETCPHFYNEYESAEGLTDGYWVFTQHDAVRDIYKTPDIFLSASITPWEPDPIYRLVPTMVDAPDHIKYRRILNPWFSPKAMDGAEDMIRSICREYVEQIAAKGSCDFIEEFALHFPTAAFLNVIGVSVSETDRFVKWVDDFFAGFSGDPAGLEPMAKALQEIREYWVAALDERRGKPEIPGDLASHLLHVEYDGERPLTDEEMLDMLTVLVLAGLDTTRGELGYMFHHLALNPQDRERLIAEPEIIPLAVEETLRYYTIIFGDGRKVSRDTDFYGVQLKKGDMVYGLVSAANRDPNAWERAEEFVIDRKRNNHMGFANGPHRCLGMHLARREMQIAVEEWLRLIPDFELTSDEGLFERGGGSMMSLNKLPLRWELSS